MQRGWKEREREKTRRREGARGVERECGRGREGERQGERENQRELGGSKELLGAQCDTNKLGQPLSTASIERKHHAAFICNMSDMYMYTYMYIHI